jgi:pimeloyl-ACP methyl ester carboxylesterase
MGHDEMALDVVALVNRLQFPQVVLVGHSMGGKVAQAMALLYPERVAGLIVLDMAPVSYVHYQNHHHHPTEDSTRDDPSVQYDSNWNTIRDILHVLTSVPLEPGMAKRDVDVFLRPHISDPAIRAFCLTNLEMVSTSAAASTKATTMPRWKIPLAKIAQQLDRLAGFDLQSSSTPSHSMFMYDGDVFFITGGQSKFVRSVHLPTIQRFFPNHMVSTIRGAGHWVHAEAPAETIALIKRYLDRTR